MCGLAGFFGKGDLGDLERMGELLSHRGKDDCGDWIVPDRGAYLTHRRLAIIDLEGGKQPMVSRDGRLILVFNGAIYNAPSLRVELEGLGAAFQTDHSDTEVILQGYRIWGEDLPRRLNGMWAFALYDSVNQTLFCSRDRVGQKPFYYYETPDWFGFASQLDSLCSHPEVKAQLSPKQLQKFLVYSYVPEPGTLYQGVKRLPAGTSLFRDIREGRSEIKPYWSFQIKPKPEFYNLHDAACELKFRLAKAVKRRLLSDVELGMFLSGGIDSSIICLLAKNAASTPLTCYSIGFADGTFDETPYSKAVADQLGLSHVSESLKVDDLRRQIPRVLGSMDDVLGDSSLIPTEQLCRIASKHVKVALGGDGADELFAGYAPFRALNMAQRYKKWVPKPLHQAIQFLVHLLPVKHGYMSLDFKLKKTLQGLNFPPPLWLPVWMGSLDPEDWKDLFADPLPIEELFEEAIEIWDGLESDHIVDKALAFFTRLYLTNGILTKVDRAGMINHLEVRSPFLDVEVLDLAMSLQSHLKMKGNQTKLILKTAFESDLPAGVLNRQKHGFAIPIGHWMARGDIQQPQTTIPGLNPDKLNFLWQQHLSKGRDNRLFLWNHLVLAQFLERHGNSQFLD